MLELQFNLSTTFLQILNSIQYICRVFAGKKCNLTTQVRLCVSGDCYKQDYVELLTRKKKKKNRKVFIEIFLDINVFFSK